eukprot:6206296-Pleurochrysis_carterae.AAC.1
MAPRSICELVAWPQSNCKVRVEVRWASRQARLGPCIFLSRLHAPEPSVECLPSMRTARGPGITCSCVLGFHVAGDHEGRAEPLPGLARRSGYEIAPSRSCCHTSCHTSNAPQCVISLLRAGRAASTRHILRALTSWAARCP